MGYQQNSKGISVTGKLASFIANTKFKDLPKEIVEESKRIIIDAIACQIGGYPTEIGELVIRYVRKLGGNPQATVLATGEKTNTINAAYANGKIGNALDYDDIFPTITHFGEVTVAAGLSLCEVENKSGKDLITSVAVGYEVAARVSMAFGGSHEIKDGKVQGTKRRFGVSRDQVFGPAAASAHALGQEVQRVCNTLAIAGGNCPVPTHGRWSEMIDLPIFKYCDSGWCAQTGVAAALLAEEGYTGYENIFDGERGFGLMYGEDSFVPSFISKDLGQEWHLQYNVIKPWSCCRLQQYALTVLVELFRQHEIKREDIEKISVGVDHRSMQKRFSNRDPQSMVSAQFSFPHAIAVFILGVPRGPKWQTKEMWTDPAVAELRNRVFLELDPRTEQMNQSFLPGGLVTSHPCFVEIITKKGERFKGSTDYAWGDGGLPPNDKYRISNKDLEEKFREAVTSPGCLFAGRARESLDAVIDLLWSLENLTSVPGLTQAISGRVKQDSVRT